jgi:putative tricarboxylic transport membrane protein
VVVADRVIFVCIIVLAAVYFWATAQIPSLEIGDPLGPKAFPRLLGIVLLFTGGLLLFEMWRAKNNGSQEAVEAPDRRVIGAIAAVVAWTAVYFVSFEPAGYVIATTLYLIPVTAYFNRGRWVMNVSTCALFALISYTMFTKMLGVNLARGIFPF